MNNTNEKAAIPTAAIPENPSTDFNDGAVFLQALTRIAVAMEKQTDAINMVSADLAYLTNVVQAIGGTR